MSDTTPVAKATPFLVLSGRTYDFLKLVAQIILPGIGALYFALAAIWGLPNAEEVVGTITAVDVFLGLFLGASSQAYNASDSKYDGTIDVEYREDGTKAASLNLSEIEDPADIDQKSEVTFKVRQIQ